MLYLVRHATSDQPLLRAPGDLRPATREEWLLDHGLSVRGREEAARLGTRLATIEAPDRVLSSPRRRTLETALLAYPAMSAVVDPLLDEWHDDESEAALLARARRLLELGEEGTAFVFTHGGFIRAVVAALLVREDASRFTSTFHDLRRALHVWNASVTVLGHGASGLELVATNVHSDLEPITGRA